jgi:hypothetical protein
VMLIRRGSSSFSIVIMNGVSTVSATVAISGAARWLRVSPKCQRPTTNRMWAKPEAIQATRAGLCRFMPGGITATVCPVNGKVPVIPTVRAFGIVAIVISEAGDFGTEKRFRAPVAPVVRPMRKVLVPRFHGESFPTANQESTP